MNKHKRNHELKERINAKIGYSQTLKKLRKDIF
nr:MAG TPA: hypothetical protein [Caudoviricetes sp.]